jgi:hypothetical protein
MAKRLATDWNNIHPSGVLMPSTPSTTAGVFVDLHGDGTEEFVLLSAAGGPVYQSRGGRWAYVGRLSPEGMMAPWPRLAKALSSGSIITVAPVWKDLSVGADRYRMFPQPNVAFISEPHLSQPAPRGP